MKKVRVLHETREKQRRIFTAIITSGFRRVQRQYGGPVTRGMVTLGGGSTIAQMELYETSRSGTQTVVEFYHLGESSRHSAYIFEPATLPLYTKALQQTVHF